MQLAVMVGKHNNPVIADISLQKTTDAGQIALSNTFAWIEMYYSRL